MQTEGLALNGHGPVSRSRVLEVLSHAFAGADPGTIASVADLAETLSLSGGDCLFHQGEPGDALYVVETGRLRVFNEAADSAYEVHLSEIGRGELVGEAALVDGAPRAASVYAIRDTRLLRLRKEAYETLLSRDPRLGLQLARVALGRVRRGPSHRARPVCFTLVPTSPGVDVHGLARGLIDFWGEGAHIVTDGVLDDVVEAQHSHVVHVVEGDWNDASRQALRSADRIVLVADARTDPTPRPGELEMWRMLTRQHDALVSLALVHPADTAMPSGTPGWLDPRPGLVSHHHVKSGDTVTVARLARLLEGSGTSLVLGGGGARGFAHLGVVQVLEELDHPVDMVGGTSIGAVMATGAGMGLSADAGREIAANAFRKLLDFTFPVASVIKGRRITRSMHQMYGDLDISDLWVPYFCISTNLTRGRPHVHDRGPLVQALRASISIPGVLPPVPYDGDLLVDGGLLDNVPVGEMRRRNPTGAVIAVDVAPGLGPRARGDYGLAASGLRALIARRRGGGPPRLLSTMVRSTIVGSAQERGRIVEENLADLYIELECAGGGMLDFSHGDADADDAADRTRPVLQAWAQDEQTPGYVRVGRPERHVPTKKSRLGRIGGVLLLTARDLQFRATRFGSAILGTAVVFTMLFLMTGLTEQFHREPRLMVNAMGSDAWLLRAGTSGPFTSGESIPTTVLDRVRGAEGAPLAVSRLSITDGVEDGATRLDAVLVGFVPGELGSPILTAGRLPEAPLEVVLDEAADIPVGGEVGVGPEAFTVVGTTQDTTLFAGMPFVYLPLSTVQQMLFQGRPLASTFLLDGEPTRLPAGYAIVDGAGIAEDTLRPLENAVGSVNMIRILLWFVAAMIIGTLSYLSALDRSRDVAVLKAVGGGTGQLGSSIALQGVLVALTAVAAASVFQYFLVPQFPLDVYVPGNAFVQLPLIAIVVALLSGAVGLRKAIRTDPALAFSGPGQ